MEIEDVTKNPMQAVVNEMGRAWQRMRSESDQMTLGQMIEKLEALPPEAQVVGLGRLDSYRGYYCDLAFAPVESIESAAELLSRCREAMGKVYIDYKGGQYLMGETTPLWISGWGDVSGMRLMALQVGDGGIVGPYWEREE